MTQKPPVGKLWGIVLAGEKAREFVTFSNASAVIGESSSFARS